MWSWMNLKTRQYNSRVYDLTNTNDFTEFYNVVDILNDFDFAIKNMKIIYTGDYNRATLHVETRQEMLEIWLVKHQFVEA